MLHLKYTLFLVYCQTFSTLFLVYYSIPNTALISLKCPRIPFYRRKSSENRPIFPLFHACSSGLTVHFICQVLYKLPLAMALIILDYASTFKTLFCTSDKMVPLWMNRGVISMRARNRIITIFGKMALELFSNLAVSFWASS